MKMDMSDILDAARQADLLDLEVVKAQHDADGLQIGIQQPDIASINAARPWPSVDHGTYGADGAAEAQMTDQQIDEMPTTIQHLDCRPGDTLIFKIAGVFKMSVSKQCYIQKYIESKIPDGVKVLLLDNDIEVTLVCCEP